MGRSTHLVAWLALGALPSLSCHADRGPSTARVASPPPADAGSEDPLSEKLRHCPLTVEGATADLRDIDGGVEFVIRVPSDEGRRELAKRARHLETFTRQRGAGTGVPHGMGQGGGWMRDCPVVTKDTLVESTELPEGARLTVVVTTGSSDELRTETRRRLVALQARKNAPAR